MSLPARCCGSRLAAASFSAHVPSPPLPSNMSSPGTLPIAIIVVLVLVAHAFNTLLSFVPLALFIAAFAYLVRHV